MSIVSSLKSFFQIKNKLSSKNNTHNKVFSIHSVNLHIVVVVAAFTLLLFLSSWLMGNIVRNNMKYSLEAAFNDTERNIITDLNELETKLLFISETVRQMILKSNDLETIKQYVTDICYDIILDRARNYAVNTYFEKGGYGMLLNKNLEILAHPDSELLNKPLKDIQNYSNFANIADDLKNGRQVTERRIRNYKNEKCVLSFRQLPNGWHIGIVIQEKIYYRELIMMRITLITSGIIIAAIFIAILLRLSEVQKELKVEKEENGLSKREQEIFAMLLKGITPKEIGYTLKISPHTVAFHRGNLYRKLGVSNITEFLSKYVSAN